MTIRAQTPVPHGTTPVQRAAYLALQQRDRQTADAWHREQRDRISRRVAIHTQIDRAVDQVNAARQANGTIPQTLGQRGVLLCVRAADIAELTLDPSRRDELVSELIGAGAEIQAALEQLALEDAR